VGTIDRVEYSRSDTDQEWKSEGEFHATVCAAGIDIPWLSPGSEKSRLQSDGEFCAWTSIINSGADPSANAKGNVTTGPAEPCSGGGPPPMIGVWFRQYAALQRDLLGSQEMSCKNGLELPLPTRDTRRACRGDQEQMGQKSHWSLGEAA